MKLPAILISLLVSGVSGASITIHPTPRETHPSGGSVTLSRGAALGARDPAASPSAIELVRSHLAALKHPEGGPSVVIGTRGSDGIGRLLDGVPEVSGAYRLVVAPDRVVLAGHDARGTYYAALTLGQLLAGGDGELPAIDIRDWPAVPHRGIVEGFYGTPWPHDKRLRLIDYLGRHKMDTYIYGPKDDPYHSSPHWRDPYPAAQAARIRELAERSAASHVDFYWAVHPGKDIRWNHEDEAKVLAKFESMYQLGVRAFAVFFDDISGEGTKADRQAGLLNTIHREFVTKKGDVRPLVMCPTQYNKAWSGGDYLDTLGTRLDPSIHVMWTGNTVVADLDRPSMEWINTRLRRKAYIWWNFPVSDYVRNHLLMGPVYGNSPDIGPLYGGFVSNPMERSEASKVALFGVAGYTWNPPAYDPEASFVAATREVMPGAPDAFEVFCRHNSDLGPNGHGYRRKESEAFAPAVETFMTAFRQEKPADATAVRAELTRIREAPSAIRSTTDNPQLVEEIRPWLDAFAQLGSAGVAALDAHAALKSRDGMETWRKLAAANAALAEMAEIDRTENRNPYQPGVRTGSLVITPFVRELVATTSARFLSTLSGRPVFRPAGITSAGAKDGLPLMLDGKDDTFYYCKENQKAGDWFGVDLGGLHEVRRIRLLQGRGDDDHDRVHQGVIEGSDGDSWETIAKVESARIDTRIDPARKFRSVRLRIEQPGSSAKADLWTAIRTFEINPPSGDATLRTNLPPFSSQPVRLSEGVFSISPGLEVHPFPPGKYLGLQLPAGAQAGSFEVDLKTPAPEKHFALEITADGREWKRLAAKTAGTTMSAVADSTVIAARVRNTGRDTPSVTLVKFTLATETAAADGPPEALSDGRLDTTAPVPVGSVLHPPASEKSPVAVTLLLAPDWKGPAKVEALVGNTRRPLADVSSPLSRLPLPPGATGIVISSSAAPLPLHEVIWSGR